MDIALKNEILRGLVGGQAHGIRYEDDPSADRDEMGVFIEPPENVCGLKEYDFYGFRTQPEGVRSGAGDLDLSIYSLRKFIRLCTQGNPTVLLLLYLPDYLIKTPLGERLTGMRELFVSKEAGQRFLGYLVSQKMKMKGEKAHTVNRPDLVEKYGYDTKFAMHALRLGYEGIEFLCQGTITVPKVDPVLSTLRNIRYGRWTEKEALDAIESTENILRELVNQCDLKVNRDKINQHLVEMHNEFWVHQILKRLQSGEAASHPAHNRGIRG